MQDWADPLRRVLFDPVVGKLVLAVAGVLLIVAVTRFVSRMLPRYVSEAPARYRARKGLTFLAWVVAILFVASVFGERLGTLTIAFGVAGAGVAFALQEIIASVAGWLAISFGGYYTVGDRVMLGGIKGDVIDIGMLRTTVFELGDWISGDAYNGRVVRIGNSFIFREPVYNYSGDFPFLWDELRVPIRFGSDRAQARRILEEVAERVVGDYAREAAVTWRRLVERYTIEEARVQPTVTMTMDENWMTFTLRYVVDYRERRRTRDRLFTGILEAIEASQGRVSVASSSQEITLFHADESREEPPPRSPAQ